MSRGVGRSIQVLLEDGTWCPVCSIRLAHARCVGVDAGGDQLLVAVDVVRQVAEKQPCVRVGPCDGDIVHKDQRVLCAEQRETVYEGEIFILRCRGDSDAESRLCARTSQGQEFFMEIHAAARQQVAAQGDIS